MRTLRANFDSVLLTAQNEIDRLKRQIDVVRKEKDDIVFRRGRPKNVVASFRDFATQTIAARKVNFGVQTDDVERSRTRDVKESSEHSIRNGKRDEKESGNKERRTDNRLKRFRSRSREKSSRSSSKHSASENERKRARHENDDRNKDVKISRGEKRRSSEKEKQRGTQSRTIATRKLTRISEGQIIEKEKQQTRNEPTERKKSKEKSFLIAETIRLEKEFQTKSKRKSKTPKKAPKKDIDPVEQELETLMSGHQKTSQEPKTVNETLENESLMLNNGSDKVLKCKSKLDSIQDLRMLLESKKFNNSRLISDAENFREKGSLDEKTQEKVYPLRSVKQMNDVPVLETIPLKVNRSSKTREEPLVTPLELLW